MASGVAGSSRLGARYQKRNHGLEGEVGYINEYVRAEDIASAEGAKLRLPKAGSPLRLGVLGERRKHPPKANDAFSSLFQISPLFQSFTLNL